MSGLGPARRGVRTLTVLSSSHFSSHSDEAELEGQHQTQSSHLTCFTALVLCYAAQHVTISLEALHVIKPQQVLQARGKGY